MKQKNTKTLVRLLIVVLVLFVGEKIVIGFIENKSALNEYLPSTHTFSSEDSILISPAYIDSLKMVEKYQSKVRNPVTLLEYRNRYSLLYYKFDSLKDFELSNVKIKQASVDRTQDVSYRIIVNNYTKFKLEYKSGLLKPASELFLTFSGDSIKNIIKSNSVIGYSLLLNNLSIKYNAEEPIDFYIENAGNFVTQSPTHLNLFLFKKHSEVYLLIVTPINGKEKVEERFPEELFQNN